jgi:hypothetical protein
MEKIELEIKGNEVISDWWTPAVKELFCAICEEKECNEMTCQIANPWCG